VKKNNPFHRKAAKSARAKPAASGTRPREEPVILDELAAFAWRLGTCMHRLPRSLQESDE
jgi:hypothetical protein